MVITRQQNATAEANPIAVLAENSRTSFIFNSLCSLPNFVTLVFASAVAFCCLDSLEDDDAGLDDVPLDSESEL